MNDLYLYALKQKSKNTGKTYYRNLKNNDWVETVNENCLVSDKYILIDIGDKCWPHNYILVKFKLTQMEEY